MKAMKVEGMTANPMLVASELALPLLEDGDDVLIEVRATGVTPTELAWYPTTHTKDGALRVGAAPGHEFSGVVAALGKGATGFVVGQEVYGMNDWFADGATAEYCLTKPQWIAPKPASLTHEEAATVPIGALTAWQGLFARAIVHAGQRVLVHGAAGAVGLFVVQLARMHGAYVIATVSGHNVDFVKELGAELAINYRASRFEEVCGTVDVVFDTVGGETLDRSWQVLAPTGRVVTIAADVEGTRDQRAKGAFFIVEPSRQELEKIAALLDEGKLKTYVSAVVPLADASAAYGKTITKKLPYGKVVLAVSSHQEIHP
jgi:NADPH:quinone reductase-like Zn-dependent oxidoreductase